jgi:hypothetical protein
VPLPAAALQRAACSGAFAEHRRKVIYLSAKAHTVASYDLLAVHAALRWSVAIAATNVHIHITAAAPPAVGINVDSGTAIHSASVATAFPDIDVDTGAATALGGALLLSGTFFTRAHLSAAIGLRPGTLLRPGTPVAALALSRTWATAALAAAGSSTFSAILPASAGRLATAGLRFMHQALERDRLGSYRIAAKSKHRPEGGQN